MIREQKWDAGIHIKIVFVSDIFVRNAGIHRLHARIGRQVDEQMLQFSVPHLMGHRPHHTTQSCSPREKLYGTVLYLLLTAMNYAYYFAGWV